MARPSFSRWGLVGLALFVAASLIPGTLSAFSSNSDDGVSLLSPLESSSDSRVAADEGEEKDADKDTTKKKKRSKRKKDKSEAKPEESASAPSTEAPKEEPKAEAPKPDNSTEAKPDSTEGDSGETKATKSKKKKRRRTTTEEQAAPEGGTETPAAADETPGDKPKKRSRKGTQGLAYETLVIPEDVPLVTEQGKKTDEVIRELLGILKDGTQNAELLRRLAEMYWKKSKILNLEVMEKHQKGMEAWDAGGKVGDPPKEPDPELWRRYNRKVVEICKHIQVTYPDYESMDEVLYFIGYNLKELGQDEEAVEYYKLLIANHPASVYIPEAWLAIGNYYFDHNNVYEAKPAFEEVVDKYQDSKVWGLAMYKLGWCYFNLGMYRESIDAFKDVVAWSDTQEKKGLSKISLKEEALKDLVMAFAEAGTVEEAEKYFLDVGGKKYFRMMLIRLAEIWTTQGRLADVITIYKRLIKDYPEALENSDFQTKIVDCYMNLGNKDAVRTEIVAMVDYAKPREESPWVNANIDKNPERVQEAKESAERMMAKTTVEYHKEAQKTKVEATYDIAQGLYELYIKYFSWSERAYDMNYYYAELLYERSKFAEAGEQYKKVALMKDSKGENKHFEESSYHAILSYEKLVHKEIDSWVEETKQRSKRGEKSYKLATTKEQEEKEKAQQEQYAPREMSPYTKGFIEACNIYIEHFPQSKYRIDIIYKVAVIHYAHNNFDQAVASFELIVRDYPDHRLAEYAANLILDSLNIKGRWRELNKTVRLYLKNPRLVKNEAFRRDLVDLLEKSSFKMVEITIEEKNYKGAADEYVAFADEFPKSEMKEMALYNAVVFYNKCQEIERGIVVRTRFLKEHPKSKYAEEMLFLLARDYETLADYENAAARFEEYSVTYVAAKTPPKDPAEIEKEKTRTNNRLVALLKASRYYESLGKVEKSIELKKKFIEQTPDAEEKDFHSFQIAITYLEIKDAKNAEKQFKAYLDLRARDITWPTLDKDKGTAIARGKIKGDMNRIFQAHQELINLYRKDNRVKDEEAAFETIYKLGFCDPDGKTGYGEAARDLIAESHFRRLQGEFERYKAITIEVNNFNCTQEHWNKVFGEKMKAKAEKAAAMAQSYMKIVELKSARWTVASLYMIGDVYLFLSYALNSAEIPFWFDDDQKAIYSEQVRLKFSEPALMKALDYWEKALNTAYKLGVRTDYVNKARERLVDQDPEKILKPVNEIKPTPGYQSDVSAPIHFVGVTVQNTAEPEPEEAKPEETKPEAASPAKGTKGEDAKPSNPKAESKKATDEPAKPAPAEKPKTDGK